jgi:predicted RNase H-like nuclease (RuvC/YqgF family)
MTDDKAGMTRYTVTEAARILDVGTDAVRKRIQRNTIKHERIDGTVYVWLDTDEPERDDLDKRHDQRLDIGVTYELVESYREQVEAYRDQVEFLRRELERKDTIIMSMTQRIPELETAREVASEPRESPATDAETEAKGDVPQEQAETKIERSWWRRFFGV